MDPDLGPRPSPRKSPEAVAREWDQIAEIREAQIETGADTSFHEILLPAIRGYIPDVVRRLIDVGCGTGALAFRLLDVAQQVIGVDPSRRSIEIADSRVHSLTRDRVRFVKGTIEELSGDLGTADCAVANMSLASSLSLAGTLGAIARVLEEGGVFIFTIPHPCYWPRYWKYEEAEWYSYWQEIAVEAPFKISSMRTAFVTTHIHRPLHLYVACLVDAGFVIEGISELPPEGDSVFALPRFMAVRAKKVELR
jgi:ubiquinone/menaquinone biosynthesis C-methylase UbiE